MEHEEKEHWRLKLGIEFGMSKEEALEKFREWRAKMKTCQRCQENVYKYKEFCPIYLICKEADEHGIEDRSTVFGDKSCQSSRHIEIDSLRTTPKRITVDKFGR